MSQKLLLSLSVLASLVMPSTVLAEQVIIQQGGASASASGTGNFAAGRVHQSATQNQQATPNAYVNELGQLVTQDGQCVAAADGSGNVVVCDINQGSAQNQQGAYATPQNQQGVQDATSNAGAVGQDNTVVNTTGQYNLQNQWSY